MTEIVEKKTKPYKRRLKNVRVDEISLVDNPAVPASMFVISKRAEQDASVDIEARIVEVEELTKAMAGAESFAVQDALRLAADAIGMMRALKGLLGGDVLPADVASQIKGLLTSAGVQVEKRAAADPTDDDGQEVIEKASRVFSGQVFKEMTGALQTLNASIQKARKITKSADFEDEAADVEDTDAPPDAGVTAAQPKQVAKADTATDDSPAGLAPGMSTDAQPSTLSRAGALLQKRREDALKRQRESVSHTLLAKLNDITAQMAKTAEMTDSLNNRLNRATGKA